MYRRIPFGVRLFSSHQLFAKEYYSFLHENTSFQNTPYNFRESFYHYITNTIIISIPLNTKTPHRLLDEEFVLNIEFYFNISPASYTLCRGDGIDICLCILNRQGEFSELSEDYCVSNKVPGDPFQIFDFVNGWGSYFLPSAIAACGSVSKAGDCVIPP